MDFQSAAAYNPNREQQRPYVRFETRAQEDRSVVSPDGVTHMVDVAWAIVRAPGAKDSLEKPALDWLKQLEVYARDERVPAHWPAEYRNAFKLWQQGEEVPVSGTAIKTWPPLTPAQRANVLQAGILTVEDLAKANDENRTAIGMNAHTLQQMAQKWLEESVDRGATAQALSAAMLQMADMKELLAAQAEQIKTLVANQPKVKA